MAAIGSVISAVSGLAAMNQQKKAAALQQKQSELQNRRSQRQAFREAQIRRAQSTVSSVAGGSNFSSGLAGGMSSLSSQLGETLGYSSQMSGLNKQISMAQQRGSFFEAFAGFASNTLPSFAGMLTPRQQNPQMARAGSERF